MFGFLRGNPRDRRYRQLYAWYCSSQRQLYGFRSLPFVSYESIFALSLAVDAGLIDPIDATSVTCCKMRKRHSAFASGKAHERSAAEFAASLAMLLADVKLSDDVADDRSVPAALMRRTLGRPIRRAREHFALCAPDFEPRLSKILRRHAEWERAGTPAALDAYTTPTADAFGMLFEMFAVAIGGADLRLRFRTAGEHLGRALIAFDCAVDYPRDQRRGNYNPLSSSRDIVTAFEYSERELTALGWLVGDSFAEQPSRSISQSTLRHRIDSIRRQRRDAATSCPSAARTASRARRGNGPWMLTPRRMQTGDCDCDCGGCDCNGCDGVGGSGDGMCWRWSCGGCDPCTPCCEGIADCMCSDRKSAKQTPEMPGVVAEPGATGWDGREADVVVALSPYGTISIAGEVDGESTEAAAKSEEGIIDAGERVQIIQKESFGYRVKRLAAETRQTPEPDEPKETP